MPKTVARVPKRIKTIFINVEAAELVFIRTNCVENTWRYSPVNPNRLNGMRQVFPRELTQQFLHDTLMP